MPPSSSSSAPAATSARLIWLQLTFSAPLDAAAADLFRARLKAYLSHSGLAAVTSLGRVALVGTRRPVTALDRALVLAWLVDQPQVALVRIERRPRGTTQQLSPGPRHG